MANDVIQTRYGLFTAASKGRLDLTYDYEDSTLCMFRKVAEKLRVNFFLDIGANIGCYSVFMNSLPCLEKIYCFEPAPVAYQEMLRNIQFQDRREIFVPYDVAVSNTEGTCTFLVESDMSGRNRIDPKAKGQDTIQLACSPVDALLHCCSEAVAIKIDVEGHEIAVIEGMRQLLKHNSCFVQVECLEPQGAERIQKIMKALGLRLVFVLRDDYIFISEKFSECFEQVQSLYFQAVQEDLRDLLALRQHKRNMIHHAFTMLRQSGYPYDPVLLQP